MLRRRDAVADAGANTGADAGADRRGHRWDVFFCPNIHRCVVQ
jgi:hypothetical protein